MLRNRTRSALVAAHIAAVALGAVAALGGLSAPKASGASAATHCTRYAPVISQDYHCDRKGTMYGGGQYSTPSTAKRDSNRIDVNATRSLAIRYSNGNWIYATGTSLSQGGSGGVYVSALCAINSQVTGRCRTNWHD